VEVSNLLNFVLLLAIIDVASHHAVHKSKRLSGCQQREAKEVKV